MSLHKLEKLAPWLWYVIAAVVVLLDQLSKWIATTNLSYNQPEVITSFFNWTLRYNYGVAFSLFDDMEGGQRWPLSILAAAVSIGLVVWIYRAGKNANLELLGLGLILGGAIGNLYDRVVLGYVVDFIEVHWQDYYWPAFNIADSAICVGAGCLIYHGFFRVRNSDRKCLRTPWSFRAPSKSLVCGLSAVLFAFRLL